MIFHTTRLANGCVIATAEMPHMHSCCVALWALAGSRHESARHGGIAHFVEHLVFKGTASRSATQILREVEGVGGSLDAYTETDHTCYYARATPDRLGGFADVLFDMYRNAAFATDDVEREREVIEEEILMYQENPGQAVDDLLSETAWPGHPLGRPITGTPATLARTGADELRAFNQSRYVGANTLVTVAGPVAHAEVVACMEAAAALPRGRRAQTRPFPQADRTTGPRLRFDTREIEQAHFSLAFHTHGRTAGERHASKLLSVLLGENMSSRLFQRLREDRGLCYSVQSDLTLLEDTGLFTVYAGVDAEKIVPSVQLALRELRKLADRPPTKPELAAAKDYTIGMLRLSADSTTAQAMWLGESLLAHRRAIRPEETIDALAAVTPAEISSAARTIFQPARATLAAVAPPVDRECLRRLLTGN